jgi:hypothetical protein
VLAGAAGLFVGEAVGAAPAVDIKVLHAKIGELTLELIAKRRCQRDFIH